MIHNNNGALTRFEIELNGIDLPRAFISCCLAHGDDDPEFFIDTNNPTIKALLENQDPRLFEILTNFNCEIVHVLEQQLSKWESERAEIAQRIEFRPSVRPIIDGYVYLAKADRYYKIGRSKRPKIRISEIGLQLPFPVDVLHVIQATNMYLAEKELHSILH